MRTTIALLLASVCTVACGSPTEPDPRTGYVALRAVCDDTGSTQLTCAAKTYCAGLYRCPEPQLDGADVTARTQWTVEHPAIVRQGAPPNAFVAVAPGHTVIRAHSDLAATDATVRVAVFPGAASPLMTTEVWGRVTEAGTTPPAGISGAVIELSGALVATQTAISGGSPSLLPGYVFVLGGNNGFQFFGVPRGTYQVSIRANGFTPQAQSITVAPPGSPASIDFQLRRAN
jgi:hypothetical protein